MTAPTDDGLRAALDDDLQRFVENVETGAEDNGTRAVLIEDLRALARDWMRDRDPKMAERGWHAGHGRQDAEPPAALSAAPAPRGKTLDKTALYDDCPEWCDGHPVERGHLAALATPPQRPDAP